MLSWPCLAVLPFLYLLGRATSAWSSEHDLATSIDQLWQTTIVHPPHQPTCMQATTTCKVPLFFTSSYVSQFKEDRGKPSMSAQKFNPITNLFYKQMTEPGFEPLSYCCPSKYCNHTATEADTRFSSVPNFTFIG